MFIIFILFASSFQKLTLIQPQKLIDDLGSDIKYSIAKFGEIPWGHRMIGSLIPAYPIMGCDSIQPSQDHEFIFIERGECTFVTKVRNAQNAGFKLVIIGDNINQDIDNNFYMQNDGSGSTVNIPSIIIGSKWTKEFMDIFSNYPGNSEYEIKLLIKFDIIKSKRVDVLFSIDLLNNKTLQIMSDYKPYQELFEAEEVIYQFLYPIFSLNFQSEETIKFETLNCISEGRYCTYDPDGDDYGTGQDILEEIIRQLCLKKMNIDQQFRLYKDLFKDRCNSAYMFEQCFNKIVLLLNFPISDVQKCFDNSFKNLKTNSNTKLKTYNSLLEEQLEIMSEFSYQKFPPVVLNHHFVLENVTATNIFINVCQSFLVPPYVCENNSDDMHKEDSSKQSNMLLRLFIILLAISFIFLFMATLVYKKLVQRDSQEQTREQVHELVTQYIKFVESKSSQKKSSQ